VRARAVRFSDHVTRHIITIAQPKRPAAGGKEGRREPAAGEVAEGAESGEIDAEEAEIEDLELVGADDEIGEER
jgi:hypothetical protein